MATSRRRLEDGVKSDSRMALAQVVGLTLSSNPSQDSNSNFDMEFHIQSISRLSYTMEALLVYQINSISPISGLKL
ncbi:Uncharacterized protein TCM_032446 [Theobroma cacao]|uniref:Uncharacterized protein n=1 Tax=Theobroma cacao TaxID=3641 RepID=A0A061F8Y7_THECC|nr:Uncharacterized protein TCM_032446 [Theobroma cacao]